MVLAQVPGGLSPEARPVRERGACPQAGQVSHSRRAWAVQAKVQPSRQASSHRPSRSARHDGQYRDPRRRTGPERQVAVQDRAVEAPGRQSGLVLDAAQHLARDAGHQAAGAGRHVPAQRRDQRADGDLVAAGQGLQPAVQGLTRDERDPQRQRPGRGS